MFCPGTAWDVGLNDSASSKGPSKGPKIDPDWQQPLLLPGIRKPAVQPLEVGRDGWVGRHAPELPEL